MKAVCSWISAWNCSDFQDKLKFQNWIALDQPRIWYCPFMTCFYFTSGGLFIFFSRLLRKPSCCSPSFCQQIWIVHKLYSAQFEFALHHFELKHLLITPYKYQFLFLMQLLKDSVEIQNNFLFTTHMILLSFFMVPSIY